MTEAEVLDLSKARRVPVKQADMAQQIKEQLRQDAHKQKSHREYDAYMSANQSGYVVTSMLQALSDEPQDPFRAMAARLRGPNEGHGLTVLGADLQEMMRKDPYLGALRAEVFDELFQAAEEVEFKKGDTLFRAGEPAEALAMIIRGAVCAGNSIIGRGHLIGLGALHQGIWPHEVVATEDGRWALFGSAVVRRTLLASGVRDAYTRGTFFQGVLRQRFPQLSESEILLLCQLARPVVYAPGQIIAEKNDQLSYFVVITRVDGAAAAEEAVDEMHSNVDAHLLFQERPAPRPAEAAVAPGNVIGLEGVLIGREERRDWVCDGVVEGFAVEAEDLKVRGELLRKLKEGVQ